MIFSKCVHEYVRTYVRSVDILKDSRHKIYQITSFQSSTYRTIYSTIKYQSFFWETSIRVITHYTWNDTMKVVTKVLGYNYFSLRLNNIVISISRMIFLDIMLLLSKSIYIFFLKKKKYWRRTSSQV